MNQSALIGGALLAGFALFLAARDRLTVYGSVLWGAKPGSGEPAPSTAVQPLPGSIFGDFLSNPLMSPIPGIPMLPAIAGWGGELGANIAEGFTGGGEH